MSPNERLAMIATLKALELQIVSGESEAAKRTLLEMIAQLKQDQDDYDKVMNDVLDAWNLASDDMRHRTAMRGTDPPAWLL
jgi:hypothetical protein